jgi:hypothetical protein
LIFSAGRNQSGEKLQDEIRYRTRRESMSAKTAIAAAALAAFIAPPLYSTAAPVQANSHAVSRPQWTGATMFGAYAATTKSRRATRPASRSRVSQATDMSTHVIGLDGRDRGTDPDPAIRFQLWRDSAGGGMGGGGM